jgi:hypothetical protein
MSRVMRTSGNRHNYSNFAKPEESKAISAQSTRNRFTDNLRSHMESVQRLIRKSHKRSQLRGANTAMILRHVADPSTRMSSKDGKRSLSGSSSRKRTYWPLA